MYIENTTSSVMPTVVFIGKFRIVIETRDHNPPHVHCKGPDVMARIAIETREVMSNHGVSSKDLKLLIAQVEMWEETLMIEWRRIHGKED
jgi:hypothetical protein